MNVRKMTHSFLAKTVAIILLIALSAACLASVGIYAYFAIETAYGETCSYIESPLFRFEAQSFASRAVNAYMDGEAPVSFEKSNFRYTIRAVGGQTLDRMDQNALPSDASIVPDAAIQPGTVLATNIAPGEQVAQVETVITNYDYANSGYERFTLFATMLSPARYTDAFSRQAQAFSYLQQRTDAMIGIAGVSFVLCCLLCVFLLCASGRHTDSAEPRLGWLDRVPGDVLLGVIGLLLFGVLMCGITVGDTLVFSGRMLLLFLILLIPLYIAGMLLLIALVMSVATRIKTRTLFSNTVIARVIGFCLRLCRGMLRMVRTFFSALPLLWRTITFFLVFACVNGISLLLLFNGGGWAFIGALLFLGFNGTVFVLSIGITMQMDELRKGGEAIASGNTAHRVKTERMLPAFLKHAENLNAINQGVASAVEARMKSERMKTDLITNVSHDLKTPLTSIVNYIDLLKKEPLSETCQSYVEVLDRQAQRLKKLTTDVVEASKASSGATQVELAPTNAAEILTQSLAEYQERLRLVPLSVVVHTPETPLFVMADGRLLWRVFDNLLGNIVKYAMPGTRVYLDARADGCEAVISLKNVSRDQLARSAEELTERFVQGDASRSESGSGLGLSIAKSLVELQNGRMEIALDGDLFTARILFPMAE